MRDFKGMKRQRGRNRGGGSNTGGGGKPAQNVNRAFDSNGPDGVKIRGHAQHVYDKYCQLARDAASAGDRVLAERLAGFDRVMAGDLAWKHDNGACFLVTDPAAEAPRAEVSRAGRIRARTPSSEPIDLGLRPLF